MDTTSLKTFLTIAELGSFSLAAEKLYLTQPAISKRIQALETEMDTKLFDRIGRQSLLTPAGRILLDHAQIIMQQLEDSQREIHNLSQQIAGGLSFGTSHHIGLHRLPKILKHYSQRYPDVELDIHFMDSEMVYQQVLAGKLELGIITIPEHDEKPLDIIPLWEDKLVFVAGKSHPLTKLNIGKNRKHPGKAELSLPTLAKYPAILPSKNTVTRQIVEQAFQKNGVSINTSLSTNYLETIKMLVGVGLGWSVLPETILDSSVCILELPRLQLSRQLGIVKHPQRTPSNAATALLKLMV